MVDKDADIIFVLFNLILVVFSSTYFIASIFPTSSGISSGSIVKGDTL